MSAENSPFPNGIAGPNFGHRRKVSSTAEFKEVTKMDAKYQLQSELDKLIRTAPQVEREQYVDEMKRFEQLFVKYLQGSSSVQWPKIEPLQKQSVRDYQLLSNPSDKEHIRLMLNKLVVVKLNGGLGTSMGCVGPKSLIPVRSDLTFLDLTVQQIEHLNKTYDTNVPLVLMNSFNTDEDTQKVLRKYRGCRVKIYTFLQSRYPRIHKESLMPIATDLNDDPDSWYPPGHGDFYESFAKSGLLQCFLNQGSEYLFISNIDNLGATVDLNILNMLLEPGAVGQQPQFVMEVTDKTNADVKGGTLIQYEGKLRLLEIAQVPKDHVEEFKSVKKFKIFNTNNLWINLGALDKLLKSGTFDIEVIVNHKHLSFGRNVIQLETASGAAMQSFENAIGINVPRTRFLPVKKTQDLLLVMSNLYSLNNGSLIMNPLRSFPTVPLIKLGKHS
jgi:UTP--glucose-1-phosphate uridylyltransferase